MLYKLHERALYDRAEKKVLEDSIRKTWMDVQPQFPESLTEKEKEKISKKFIPFDLLFRMLEQLGKLDGKDILIADSSEVFLLLKTLKKHKKINYRSIKLITNLESLRGKEDIEVVDFKKIPYINLNMKFDVVIGNPPYQQQAGTSTYTIPIQNNFVKFAVANADQVLLLTQANYCGSHSSPIKTILSQNNTKIVNYTSAFKKVVSGIEVCWFHIDNREDAQVDSTTIVTKHGDSIEFKIEKNEIIPLFSSSKMLSVLEKLQSHTGLDTLYTCNLKVLRTKLKYENTGEYTVVETCGDEGKELIYRKSDMPFKFSENQFNSWKTVTPNVGGDGHIGNIKIAPPNVILTKSCIGFPFDTEEEAVNCKHYLESKLVRAIVNAVKPKTVNSKSMFSKIPIIDFKTPLPEEELYVRFGLTKDEIQTIESTSSK